MLIFLQHIDNLSHLVPHSLYKGRVHGHLVQGLLKLPLSGIVMGQDKLEDIHSAQMDWHFEQWEVEGAQSLHLSFSCRAIVRSCHRIYWTLLRLRPLLLDAHESLARYLIQEDAGEELAAKLHVLHDMERLLQNVQAEWIIELWAVLDQAEALDHRGVVRIIEQGIFELFVGIWIRLLSYFEQILHVKECLVLIFNLLEDHLHELALILWCYFLYLGLDIQPNFAQMTCQICVESCEREQAKHILHLLVLKRKYCQCY